MKQTIRRGVFETNSSSTHTLTVCSEEVYEKWKNGEYYYDDYYEELVHEDECQEVTWGSFESRYMTYDEFWEKKSFDFTTYEEKRKNGDVIFGYYGYN